MLRSKQTFDGIIFGDNKRYRHDTCELFWVLSFSLFARAVCKFFSVLSFAFFLSSFQTNWLFSQFHIENCCNSDQNCLLFCWKIQAFVSLPRFHVGKCWWSNLQFPICLKSVHGLYSLRSADSILYTVLDSMLEILGGSHRTFIRHATVTSLVTVVVVLRCRCLSWFLHNVFFWPGCSNIFWWLSVF